MDIEYTQDGFTEGLKAGTSVVTTDTGLVIPDDIRVEFHPVPESDEIESTGSFRLVPVAIIVTIVLLITFISIAGAR